MSLYNLSWIFTSPDTSNALYDNIHSIIHIIWKYVPNFIKGQLYPGISKEEKDYSSRLRKQHNNKSKAKPVKK